MSKKRLFCSATALLICLSINAFTVVIDAGHGGQDAGAVGILSKEKNINLKHALLVGDLLKAAQPDIKVIYTRDKDVFVELRERAAIANRAKADLFVSIHTNAAKNRAANGIETFTLGVSRSKENMEVAMLENSAILLEDNHEKNYQGFDPNSTDSYIMFEFMKDSFMEHSINCADQIQSRLTAYANRENRGVRQAGFLVLRATNMPSVLVELGFISNREEEKALNDTDKQLANAKAICNGILNYKHQLERKTGVPAVPATPVTDPVVTSTTTAETPGVVVAPAPAPAPDPAPAPAPTPIPATEVDAAVAPVAIPSAAATPQPEPTPIPVAATPATSAEPLPTTPTVTQVVSTDVPVFRVQFFLSKTLYAANHPIFHGIPNVECEPVSGAYKYLTGKASTPEALEELKKQVSVYFPDAFVVAYLNGKRIPIGEARKRIIKQ